MLNGQTDDLQALSTLKSADWAIVKENGAYHLTSPLLNTARDADDALQFTQELLPIINGAAQVYLPHFEPIHLAGSATILQDDGTQQTAQTQTARARIRHPIAATDIQNAPPIDAWITLAYKDGQVEKALDLWGSLEHNWRNLYLVLEVMQDTVGGETALLAQPWLPDKHGIELFKKTANNWRALGHKARHATEKYQPPPNPMSLPDARELLRRTLHAWLQQR
jgi:hypothetical protein